MHVNKLVLISGLILGSSVVEANTCPKLNVEDLKEISKQYMKAVGGALLTPMDTNAANNLAHAIVGLQNGEFESTAPEGPNYNLICKYKVGHNGIEEVWLKTRDAADKWSQFNVQFEKAFNEGDVDTLEKLKVSGIPIGFHNLNDLGGNFMKYGGGIGRWNELIADAQKNKK